MKTPNKPQRWSVYLLKQKPKWIAWVEAKDEAEALAKAHALPDVAARDKFRLSVVRD